MAVFKSFKKENDTADQQLAELQDKLEELPNSMMQFGVHLRSLYNENQVTGHDTSAKAFLEVRDNTRKNGMVYAQKVLPMTEEVVRSIGLLMDYFQDLNFDEWSECLEDIIEDVEKAQGYCEILKQLHNTIIIDLKKNEDKATVSVEKINLMATNYRKQALRLNYEAKSDKENVQYWKNKEWTVALLTLGMSLVVDAVCGKETDSDAAARRSDMKSGQALFLTTNAAIAETAVALTTTHLIPAIKNFIQGLEICSIFLTDTKERMAKMKNVADKGAKKPFYKMMQNRASEINTNTQKFLAITDMLRNNLAAIPEQPEDKNYVDKWIEQEMAKFQNENNDWWTVIGYNVKKIVRAINK